MPQITVYDESTLILGRHQIIINLRRNNLHAIRGVLNVGESLSEFVRGAVVGEVARRRSEDQEVPCGPPSDGEA